MATGRWRQRQEQSALTSADPGNLDSALVAEYFREHGASLRRFAFGLLRDAFLANDVVQTTFAKFAEHGHLAEPQKRKAWLFRVAYHEAMLLRRQHQAGQKALQQAAWSRDMGGETPLEGLVREETVHRVRRAIDGLPPEQREVIRLRIYEEKTFAEIARELGIPLGTALGRMRAGLQRLRPALGNQGGEVRDG